MSDFFLKFEYFVYGFGVGILFLPFLSIAKKVISEAKLAKQQWRQPYKDFDNNKNY